MGWSVYIQIVRDKPLTATERKKLATHAKRFKLSRESEDYAFRVAPLDAPGGVIVRAGGKWGRDAADRDAMRMYEALTALRALFKKAKLEVSDDLHVVGWNGSEYGLVDDPDQEMTKPPGDLSAWESIPPPPPPPPPREPKLVRRAKLDAALEAAVTAVAAGQPPDEVDASLVSNAFSAIERARRFDNYEQQKQLEAVLAACPAHLVVEQGLEGSRMFDGTAGAVGEAVVRVDSLEAYRERLLAKWFHPVTTLRDGHDRARWFVMRPALRDAGVRAALGEALLAADLDDSEAERAHRLLMSLVVEHEGSMPYAIARRRIDREKPQRRSEQLLRDIVESRSRAILPTLAIELARTKARRDDMIRALSRIDDARVMPLLERALATDQYTRAVVESLRQRRNARSEELLRGLLVHVDPLVRILAAQGLVAWHGEDALPLLLGAIAHAKAAGLWRAPLFSSSTHHFENVRRKPSDLAGAWPERALTAQLPAVALAPDEVVSAPARMLSSNPDVRHDAIILTHHDALAAGDRSKIKMLVAAERWHKAACGNADVSLYTWFQSCSRVHITNYWSSWRKHVSLPFDPQYKYDYVTWDWLDAHPDAIGPQVMPDELAAITSLPPADPTTRLRFTADELAAWDAEERVFARVP